MLAAGLAWARYVLLLLALVTFPLCYLIGTQNGNLDDEFSIFFVSETGDRPPESTVFTFGAVLGLTLGYLPATLAIYASLFHRRDMVYASRRTRTAFGVLVGTSSLGLVVVASFQFIHAPVPHTIGAALAITSLIALNVLIVARQLALAPRPLPAAMLARLVAVVLIVATGIVLVVPTALGDMNEESTARNVAVVAEWLAIYGALFLLAAVPLRDSTFVLVWDAEDDVDGKSAMSLPPSAMDSQSSSSSWSSEDEDEESSI